jgi:cytochrome c oxidase cbb3-type subunit 3
VTSLQRAIAVVALCAAGQACERETRRYHEVPVTATPVEGVRQVPLQAGGPTDQGHQLSPYTRNAYGQAEGKRLFSAFNCTGCHANGGGGMGPALMDDKWIYGAEPEQIYSSIVEGRANGMPAFGGKIPSQQVWQLVAYIEALGGRVPQDAAPSRNDDMSVGKPENRNTYVPPKQTGHR